MPSGQSQRARPRTTEGPRTGEPAPLSKHKAGPGRPKGSKNKPKSLVPVELANQLLVAMEGALPPDQMEYLKKVVKGGGAVATKQEVQILLAILNRNVMTAMVAEMQPRKRRPKGALVGAIEEGEIPSIGELEGDRVEEEEGAEFEGPIFRKDVTDRLKVISSLLNLLNQIEKRDEEDGNDSDQPLLTVYAKRGFDRSRLAILVGGEPGGVSGDAHGAERGADAARTVPDPLPERPLLLSAGEQVEADRVLDSDRRGGVR